MNNELSEDSNENMKKSMDQKTIVEDFEQFVAAIEKGFFPSKDNTYGSWLEEIAKESNNQPLDFEGQSNYQSVFKLAQQKLVEEAKILDENRKKFLLSLKKRVSLLMVLQKKIKKNKRRFLASLQSYDFDQKDTKNIINALVTGDLRTTDILKRNFSHHVWSFVTFKWGNFLNGGKQLNKEDVLQIAECSWEKKPFERTGKQEINRLLKGIPLVIGKVITSMALCFVFASGVLIYFSVASPIVLVVSSVLALCNGVVCLLSRGKAMVDCAGFKPDQQTVYDTIEENTQEKSNLRWWRKAFFGLVTLLACISASASAWTGIVGLLAFLGIIVTFSNPFVLIAVIGLAIIAGISFYAFQAAGIEANYIKFKNLFVKFYGKGGVAGIAKVVALTLVSIVFLAVYATLTWFTAASGISKIFKMANKNSDPLSTTLSAISTTTTMIVNTFSQVAKVFNPETYTDIRDKIRFICNTEPSPRPLTRRQRAWNGVKTGVKCLMIIGDLTTYSIAGGVESGESVGGTLGKLMGWGGSALLFMILSPIILSAVALAFTYPSLFEKKKPKQVENTLPTPGGDGVSSAEIKSEGRSMPQSPANLNDESNQQAGREWSTNSNAVAPEMESGPIAQDHSDDRTSQNRDTGSSSVVSPVSFFPNTKTHTPNTPSPPNLSLVI